MKTMKKLASVALALAMALSLAAPAFAADVTINLPAATEDTEKNVTETYKAYKILDAVVGDETTVEGTDPDGSVSAFSHVAYSIANDSPFLETIQNYEENGKKVFDVYAKDETTFVVALAEDVTTFDAVALSEALMAVENKGEPAATGEAKMVNGEQTEAAEMNLTDGYFLIVGSLGSKAILDTFGKEEVSIQTKNQLPAVKKETPDMEGLKIGDSVPFTITITAQPGASKYVFHDKMGVGLTYNEDVKIYKTAVAEENIIAATNYTVSEHTGEGAHNGFDVTFTQEFLDTIDTANTAIVITYTATINTDATVTVDTTTNKATLDFGDTGHTEDTEDTKTETPLYKFDLVKTNSANELLPNATFELKDAKGNVIPLIATSENTFRPAIASEETEDQLEAGHVEEFTSNSTAVLTFEGFGAGTYYLVEKTAPAGYNKLKDPVEVVLSEKTGSLVASYGEDGAYVPATGVQVVNLTGAELPAAGGIGTTLFYIGGAVLALGAGILLITKKRMGEEE